METALGAVLPTHMPLARIRPNRSRTSAAARSRLRATGVPPSGESLQTALESGLGERRLDIGCIAAHGVFSCDAAGCHTIVAKPKAATAFLLELIARLQDSATVPMIDVRAYAKWLAS